MFESYTNKQLDDILKGGYHETRFKREAKLVTTSIEQLQQKFADALKQARAKLEVVSKDKDKLKQLQDNLKQSGFKFADIKLLVLQEFQDPDLTISTLEKASRDMERQTMEFGKIHIFYLSMQGVGAQIQREWDQKSGELIKINAGYKKICDRVLLAQWSELEKDTKKFVTDFQGAYQEKNIDILQ